MAQALEAAGGQVAGDLDEGIPAPAVHRRPPACAVTPCCWLNTTSPEASLSSARGWDAGGRCFSALAGTGVIAQRRPRGEQAFEIVVAPAGRLLQQQGGRFDRFRAGARQQLHALVGHLELWLLDHFAVDADPAALDVQLGFAARAGQ